MSGLIHLVVTTCWDVKSNITKIRWFINWSSLFSIERKNIWLIRLRTCNMITSSYNISVYWKYVTIYIYMSTWYIYIYINNLHSWNPRGLMSSILHWTNPSTAPAFAPRGDLHPLGACHGDGLQPRPWLAAAVTLAIWIKLDGWYGWVPMSFIWSYIRDLRYLIISSGCHPFCASWY